MSKRVPPPHIQSLFAELTTASTDLTHRLDELSRSVAHREEHMRSIGIAIPPVRPVIAAHPPLPPFLRLLPRHVRTAFVRNLRAVNHHRKRLDTFVQRVNDLEEACRAAGHVDDLST
jgi:hypothetical protein